ncbi:hypothetical protein O181_016754 [Austropuccinia psidii MF-1]|uniref:Reverse transcriptase Ty1/copia-type domain-containing protein n=1 Tax=Austropuccinia psidii MF-1 TaxID=1389203 RepID=A0A9Q3GS44_9BASI|nr:hypothetical protein [Austropuccinia psidii MF-1]
MDATVYVKQVKGFEKEGKESWVWRLNKSLYGTKQAPRMWQEKLVGILTKCNMMKSNSDDSVFLNQGKTHMLHMHVDNGFIIGKHNQEVLTFLSKFGSRLSIKYKKFLTQHLGCKLDWKKNNTLEISQTDLIIKLLHDHDMDDSKGVKTPCNGNLISELDNEGEVIATNNYQKAIGSLNYLAPHIRPDIMFMVNQLSKYSIRPNAKHWTAVKHLLQYLKSTITMTLYYSKKTNEPDKILAGWADADYANSKQDRKSITGYVTTVFGNPISWVTKKQSVVAQSTTEAEFIAMNICVKQLRWMSYLLNDLGINSSKPTLYNDNSGALTISKQATLNDNTKHIEVRYQYLRELVLKKKLDIVQVSSEDMIADVLTKPLGVQKLLAVYQQLGLKDHRGVLRIRDPIEVS